MLRLAAGVMTGRAVVEMVSATLDGLVPTGVTLVGENAQVAPVGTPVQPNPMLVLKMG